MNTNATRIPGRDETGRRTGTGRIAARFGTVAAVAGLATVGLTAPSAAVATERAGAGDRAAEIERTSIEAAWLFHDLDTDLHVLQGLAPEEGCTGSPFPLVDAMTVTSPSGVTTMMASGTAPVYVYEDDDYDDALAWIINEACPAVAAGTPPVPVAAGDAHFTSVDHIAADGTVRGRTTLSGTLSTPDGEQVHLVATGTPGTFANDHVVLTD
ncbi:hypothetical protein [Agromyces sp. SYSU T0242]|uniref:hypothetical protein n=1 Tax=Agromyces litoreus TaxID=3158561 RepID=UPI00339AE98C